MRLMDNLRNAEERGRATVRHGMERAREEWADAERRIRQRMRIYPQKLKKLMVRSERDPETEAAHPAPAAEQGDVTKEPIISINGQDVSDPEIARKRSA